MTSYSPDAPIGIFDSGVGGLSVLRHIRQQLPAESLCYFADSGFAPYGEKSEAQIMERTEIAARSLLDQGVKAIVVACNTATAAAIALLREHYPDLIIVGVEPGLKPAAALSQSGSVAVLATTATLASAKYQQLAEQVQFGTQVHFLHQPCPGLASRIEQGEVDSPATVELLDQYLRPVWSSKADVLVLGCTHYPFVEPMIRALAARHERAGIKIIDTGSAIARQLERLLTQRQLLNPGQTAPRLRFTTTGAPEQLAFALTRLLRLTPQDFTIREMGGKAVAI